MRVVIILLRLMQMFLLPVSGKYMYQQKKRLLHRQTMLQSILLIKMIIGPQILLITFMR